MEFVSFELAKKLKEKGFNEVCYDYYEPLMHCLNKIKTPCTNEDGESCGIITAPTISQVLKWLREKKGIHICISLGTYSDWDCEISKIDGNVYCNAYCGCHDYGQAALVGISFVIDELI